MEHVKHVVQINILLGAWLIVAPFVLGYSGSTVELGNDIAIGALTIGCSWWILASMTGQIGASALQLLGGLWLLAAPFYFHYEKFSRAYSNNLIAGILVAAVGATTGWMLAARLRRPA
jgi:SPW repeat-containing protein